MAIITIQNPKSKIQNHASHLWLALQVYRDLNQHIRLPARTPQALLNHLAALATPPDLAAAEVAAEQTMAALRQVIAGWAPFPPWPEGGLPVEESLPIIKQALSTGQALQISYYTAGRDELTHRLVEPYRLEWRGGSSAEQSQENVTPTNEETQKANESKKQSKIGYLVGFCHRAQAERVFRVDRIHSIICLPAPDQDGQPWSE